MVETSPDLIAVNRKFVAIELACIAAVWVLAVESALVGEWVSPSYQDRAFWSGWAIALLMALPILRLGRLLLSSWAIRIDGDSVKTKASMWRDWEFSLSQVKRIGPLQMWRFSYTIVELADGRRHWIFDRYLDAPSEPGLANFLESARLDER